MLHIEAVSYTHLDVYKRQHAAYVGDFSLDRLNGLELVYRLNVHGDGQLGVQLQNLRQQLIRKLRRCLLYTSHYFCLSSLSQFL